MLFGRLGQVLCYVLAALGLADAGSPWPEPATCQLFRNCCAILSTFERQPRKTSVGEEITMHFFYQNTKIQDIGIVPEWLTLHSYGDDGVLHFEEVQSNIDGTGASWTANKIAFLKVCTRWNGYIGDSPVKEYRDGSQTYTIEIG